MKVKLFFTCAALLAVVGALSVRLLSKPSSAEEMSPLVIANIEALTSNEETAVTLVCYSSIHDKDGSKVRYCPVCDFVPGTDDLFCFKSTCISK
jgi:hypothetical protein